MGRLNVEEYSNLGMEYFKKGYNCSQSVVAAFAGYYGVDEKLALRFSASFGGGMGRMRLTCGAVSGMFMLLGMENGSVTAGNVAERSVNYETVQMLAQRFKAHTGSIICGELLGIKPTLKEGPTPEERTVEYYKKRPCVEMVGLACRIYAEYLNEINKDK